MKKFCNLLVVVLMSSFSQSGCTQDGKPDDSSGQNPAPGTGGGADKDGKKKDEEAYPVVRVEAEKYFLQGLTTEDSKPLGFDESLDVASPFFCKEALRLDWPKNSVKPSANVYTLLERDQKTWNLELSTPNEKIEIRPTFYRKLTYKTRVVKNVTTVQGKVDVDLGQRLVECLVPTEWQVKASGLEVRSSYIQNGFRHCEQLEKFGTNEVCLRQWSLGSLFLSYHEIPSALLKDELYTEFYLPMILNVDIHGKPELNMVLDKYPQLKEENVRFLPYFSSDEFNSSFAVRGFSVSHDSEPRHARYWLLLGEEEKRYMESKDSTESLVSLDKTGISGKIRKPLEGIDEVKAFIREKGFMNLNSGSIKVWDVLGNTFLKGSPRTLVQQRQEIIQRIENEIQGQGYLNFLVQSSVSNRSFLIQFRFGSHNSGKKPRVVFLSSERELGIPELRSF
jgi:hypothetical protein